MDQKEIDKRIDSLAARIVALKMEAAVDFFIESHIPATTIFRQIGHVATPIVSPMFGAERIAFMQELLSDRKNVESLQAAIREQAEANKR